MARVLNQYAMTTYTKDLCNENWRATCLLTPTSLLNSNKSTIISSASRQYVVCLLSQSLRHTSHTWSVVQLLCVLKCLGAADADDMGLGPPERGDGAATMIVEVDKVLVEGAMVAELT